MITKCEAVLIIGGIIISIGTYIVGYCKGRIDQYKHEHEVMK